MSYADLPVYIGEARLKGPIVPVVQGGTEQERVAAFVRREIERHLLELSANGFVPTVSATELRSVVARAIDDYRVSQELYGAPAVAGVVEEVSADGIAKVRLLVGGSVSPDDKVTFTLTQEPPQPAPEPYRSLDADARTRTAEWQESVRKRFERRVGAALTSTSLEGLP